MKSEEPEIKSKQASKKDKTLLGFAFLNCFKERKKKPMGLTRNMSGLLDNAYLLFMESNSVKYHLVTMNLRQN